MSPYKEQRHTNSREKLDELLSVMVAQPERSAEVTQEIEELFGQEKCVMALDMSGFSRTTQRHGIVSFLLMIHRMRAIVTPCVEEHGGVLIKAEADNLLCLFDDVAEAVQAGEEITSRLNAANTVLPNEQRLYVSIGIGNGHVLNIEDEDVFGNEVNLASKLGEDVAKMGEILLTPAARATLGSTPFQFDEMEISISGMLLTYYGLKS